MHVPDRNLLMKYSGSFWPQDYILYYYGTGGGTAEVPPLDDIDEIIADILGKTNVSISGVGKSQDIISFLYEAVEQPHRFEFFSILKSTVGHRWHCLSYILWGGYLVNEWCKIMAVTSFMTILSVS